MTRRPRRGPCGDDRHFAIPVLPRKVGKPGSLTRTTRSSNELLRLKLSRTAGGAETPSAAQVITRAVGNRSRC